MFQILTWILLFLLMLLVQPAEEGERQAAVASQGRQTCRRAGHGKLLQNSLAEALKGPRNTFSFEEQKGRVDRLKILLMSLFVPVMDVMIFYYYNFSRH